MLFDCAAAENQERLTPGTLRVGGRTLKNMLQLKGVPEVAENFVQLGPEWRRVRVGIVRIQKKHADEESPRTQCRSCRRGIITPPRGGNGAEAGVFENTIKGPRFNRSTREKIPEDINFGAGFDMTPGTLQRSGREINANHLAISFGCDRPDIVSTAAAWNQHTATERGFFQKIQ